MPLVVVNIIKPGVGVNLPMGEKSEITAAAQTWDQILLHVVPESVMPNYPWLLSTPLDISDAAGRMSLWHDW